MSANDPCFDRQGNMLSVDQAIEQLLAQASAATESERVDLAAAAGRVLAQDLASPIDVPGFDNSAMQGRTDAGPRRYPVRAGFDYHAKQRHEYVRVRLHTEHDGMPVAETFPRQGSDVLSSVAWVDGLAEITENSAVHAGETVSFLLFAEWAQ